MAYDEPVRLIDTDDYPTEGDIRLGLEAVAEAKLISSEREKNSI